MTADFEMDDHNHFPIAAAVACLAELAKRHNPAGLVRASHLLDCAPSTLLRGVAFLSECLEACEDAPSMQVTLARGAIREITGLCAALMDIDVAADGYRALEQGGMQ